MTDPPFYPPTRDEAGAEPGGEPAASRQRWRVIMFWIIGIALVLLLIVLHLTGAFAPVPTVDARPKTNIGARR